MVILASLSCSHDPVGPDPPATPGELSFTIAGSVSLGFSGTAAWPPSGSGVIARMDSAGTTLQIAGYRQTSGKPGTLSGPEPRFDFLFVEIRDTAAIVPGSYIPSASLFCRDLAFADFDSAGYAGTSGSLTLGMVTPEHVAGTFSLTARRASDSSTISITGGSFDAPWEARLFMGSPADSGGAGGVIQVGADTGTTPAYSWNGGPVYAVSVARTLSPSVLSWGIAAGGDSIASGVMHGQVPSGAFSVAVAETVLVRGVAYRVTVSRTNGAYGWKVFTP